MKHSNAAASAKTLLIVGPQPPPTGGGTASVHLLVQELSRYPAIQTVCINSSPREECRTGGSDLLSSLQRSLLITVQYYRKFSRSDAVLLFATGSFLFTLGCLLILLARSRKIPIYIKPLGGDLTLYLKARPKTLQRWMVRVLSTANGVLVQTRQLQRELCTLGCTSTYYIPGYRKPIHAAPAGKRRNGKFRLLFLSQIVHEKGPLLLLEALKSLFLQGVRDVSCDFYGPIMKGFRNDFFCHLATTPGARYRGIAEVGTATNLMKQYDALALPTFFKGEGHPGVIIEAMHAGIPVISTFYRAIPELIKDGHNGFLVPTGDSQALASAIQKLSSNPALRQKMGAANNLRGREFCCEQVIPIMLRIIFSEEREPFALVSSFE